jgi:hypothetical protein
MAKVRLAAPRRLSDPRNHRFGFLVPAATAPVARLIAERQPARHPASAIAVLTAGSLDGQFTGHAYYVGVPWTRVERGAALRLARHIRCYTCGQYVM